MSTGRKTQMEKFSARLAKKAADQQVIMETNLQRALKELDPVKEMVKQEGVGVVITTEGMKNTGMMFESNAYIGSKKALEESPMMQMMMQMHAMMNEMHGEIQSLRQEIRQLKSQPEKVVQIEVPQPEVPVISGYLVPMRPWKDGYAVDWRNADPQEVVKVYLRQAQAYLEHTGDRRDLSNSGQGINIPFASAIYAHVFQAYGSWIAAVEAALQ